MRLPTPCLPWRSAPLGWAVAGVLLIAGVPPFLRMPPWCDLTLYDLAVANLLRGGVPYRDLFDTNLPGFPLLLAGVRLALGWSTEAVRAVDFAIVGVLVWLLAKLARRGGATPAGIAWLVAGAAGFYPFVSEFNHCQRDVWLVPAVLGVALRRIARAERGGTFREAVVDGLILGFFAWVKPHLLIPAAAGWVATAWPMARVSPRPLRALGLDFLGNWLGGVLVAATFASWLYFTGAWPYLREVFTFWNPGYLAVIRSEFPLRWNDQLHIFPPWSELQVLALPVAVLTLLDAGGHVGRVLPKWLYAPAASLDERLARTSLASIYLAWTAQGLVLQRGFQYVHIPEVFLLLGLLASQRWAAAFLGLVLAVACSLSLVEMERMPDDLRDPSDILRDRPFVERMQLPHPLFNAARMSRWADCWRFGLDDRDYFERRNAVGFQVNYFAGTNWVELDEVANFLRSQNPPVADGELLAWHDSPHVLYLMLGVRPAIRFVHLSTVTAMGEPQYERMRDETKAAAPRVRFAVTDLYRVFNRGVPFDVARMSQPGTNGFLPPALAKDLPNLAATFPLNQPTVFRSGQGRGRYVVHRVVEFTDDCRINTHLGVDLLD